MALATMTNGRMGKKQLSDQLDRFDSILDGLSEALNDSVAAAAREGVRGAVKEAVIEMLTDPDLRATLHQSTAPAQAAPPTFWQRLKSTVRRGATQVGLATGAMTASVTAGVRSIRATVNGTRTGASLIWQLRKVIMLGMGIGVAVATFSYLTSHGLAAAISGAGAAATAVAVQVGFWVRKAVRRLALA